MEKDRQSRRVAEHIVKHMSRDRALELVALMGQAEDHAAREKLVEALEAAAQPGRQIDLEECIAEATAKQEAPASARSWKVITILKDGRRLGNGARLNDEAEADAYRMSVPGDLWRAFINSRAPAIAATLTVPCTDDPNVTMERTKKGLFTRRLWFAHGDCMLLDWRDLADAQAVAEINDDVAASAERRKAEFEAEEAKRNAGPAR
jgi:hypothetical protein